MEPGRDYSEHSSTSSQSDFPDHFDDLIEGAEKTESAAASPAMLSQDDFHKVFVGGFKAAHHLTRLQSLHIEPENGAAKDASAAIYETILDIPALHFMLRPGGKWWGRAMAIGIFTLPIAEGVNRELAERQRKKSSGSGGAHAQPSPRQTPPEPGDPDDDARYALTGIA